MMNTNENIKLEITDKSDINKTKRKIPDDNKSDDSNSEDNKSKANKISLENNSDNQIDKVQANTSRCMTCNRKIGLTGFQCRCEYYFCAEHRYSDRHDCTFDYKQLGKELLKKANPSVISSKIDSI